MSNDRIKVCHFASVHTTTDTRVFARECVSLAKRYDVTLIAIGNNSGVHLGVNVIAINKPKTRIHRILFTTFQVFFKALKVNAQIYHIHDAELIPFAVLLSFMGKQVVYDIHENTYHDIQIKKWIPKLFKWVLGGGYRFLEWLADKTMHIILVIAKPEFANQFSVKQHSIVQNFADEHYLKQYRIDSRAALPEHNIFYIGTLYDTYYNLDLIIEAIYLLKQQGIIVNLKIGGFYGNFINTRASKLAAYQHVKHQLDFMGYINQERGFTISQQCKIGLCLKDQPEEILVSHERKFFEYMAIGLPILCCDSAIYTDLVETHQLGLGVDLQNTESIANGIKLMLTQADLNHMQQQGIKLAQSTFNWQTQETILFELYEKITSGK